MISRVLTRKIQIYKTETSEDGFGGLIMEDVFVGEYWASIIQNNSWRDNTLGGNYIKDNYLFKIRANELISNNIDNFFINYKNNKYYVSEISYSDNLFRFLEITANGKGVD
ncbi:Bacteriophage SPP1, head-tail adaptor [uncultured Caudovirales phage]|uniref:Bacteriophage SPP1, head-tail adaptor n=1 Tax=uncultured Caudovirales phage TaxID=2100421 RepID=A0A6J5N482_9CAUD|nr:Bacteriophage SPP1, head-tail adaptor [uncultured Caudovirales phage]